MQKCPTRARRSSIFGASAIADNTRATRALSTKRRSIEALLIIAPMGVRQGDERGEPSLTVDRIRPTTESEYLHR
jgi:hypothetical protein